MTILTETEQRCLTIVRDHPNSTTTMIGEMLRIIRIDITGDIWHYIATSERHCIDDEDSHNRAACLLPEREVQPITPDETEVK